MTMQVMGTGIVGSQKKTVVVNGVEQTVFTIIHPGLTGNPILVEGFVTPGSPDEQKMERFRAAAERAKEGKGQPVRIRFSGINATTRVQSEMLSNGKVQGEALVPGVVHKVPGIDCVLTSLRQTVLDTTLEPEEFTATVVGRIEKGRYGIRDIDLMQSPLQAGMEEGFHLRIGAADYKGDAHKVLNHEHALDGAYFLSGYLVRDFNEEGGEDKKTGKPIAPWERVALKVITVFPIQEQDMGTAKNRMGAVAEQTATDPDAYNRALSAETSTSDTGASVDSSTMALL